MSLVLDSGALIAIDRGDRPMWRRLKAAFVAGDVPRTHGGVVGQVWRDGRRQARLAAALDGITIRPLDDRLGRAAGALLAAARRNDVVDAALVRLAADGDALVTADQADLARLAGAAGLHVEIVKA